MSRSWRKAIYKLSQQIDKLRAHKRVRRLVRMELAKPEPELTLLDADTREIGAEDWGTRIDMEYDNYEGVEADRAKHRRK